MIFSRFAVFSNSVSHMMTSQAKISAFLKPLQQKRTNENPETDSPPKRTKVEGQEQLEKTPEKPQKASGQENHPQSSPNKKTDSSPKSHRSPDKEKDSSPGGSPPLTPEQKQRMEQHKLTAEMKVVATRTSGLVVNMGPTWYTALEPQFSKPYFVKLSKFVEAERKSKTIFPPADQVWSWTQMTDIHDIKVVILGQDPYHGPRQAHGLCFSVQQGIPPPPSLVNIYKELQTDIEGFKHPGHGNLTGWARQGVLLLNAVLTVQDHNANSHKDRGWETLTDSVISWLNRNLDGLVFMLWGAYAQKKGACINKQRHRVLQGVHPSPLSAHRGFIGCRHFSKCNEYLHSTGRTSIDWTDLPPC